MTLRPFVASLATLLTLPMASAAPAPDMKISGRLFLTPIQRSELDTHWEQRQARRVQGEILRNDGKRTRWVDGQMEITPAKPSTAGR